MEMGGFEMMAMTCKNLCLNGIDQNPVPVRLSIIQLLAVMKYIVTCTTVYSWSSRLFFTMCELSLTLSLWRMPAFT